MFDTSSSPFNNPSDADDLALFEELPNKTYPIIYMDPPWDYKGQKQHNGAGGRDTGGAISHYPTLPTSKIKKLQIPRITADDCLLFMWATSPHLDQAIDLGKSWGFQWATVGFVWNKLKPNPGFYTMSETELCLIFKHGRIPKPRGSRSVKQLIEAKRERHSAKPQEVKDRIGEMFPEQNKIEIFARCKAPGWDSWGLDV